MAYTYDDFLKAAQGSNISFSQYDMDLAKKHPEAGLSLLSLKKDYGAATTPEQRMLINEAANELRKSYGGYSGGSDGTSFVAVSKPKAQAQNLLDQVNSYGSFNYETQVPTYENQYAQYQRDLLDAVVNQPGFSWNKENDALWPVYKKQYLREGERAEANALAQAAAASGGRMSSQAITAASQAGDYYAGQLADVIPQLRAQAYDEHMNEYQKLLSNLNAVNNQEQLDYAKHLDNLSQYNTDRNFAYNQHLSDFDILQSQLAANQEQDATEYARILDAANQQAQREQLAYERQKEQQALEQAQIDAILAAGGSPSAQLVGSSGYSNEYIQALEEAYRRENAAALAAKSGTGSTGGGTGGQVNGGAGYDNGGLTTTQVMELQNKLGVEADGMFGPNTMAAAGGLDAVTAYQLYVVGNGQRPSAGSDRTKISFSEDEGLFTWNGQRYNWQELAEEFNRANLTADEKLRLMQVLDQYGFGITFGED